jgi:eukaryotic-like serine/threonine-protein kinase
MSGQGAIPQIEVGNRFGQFEILGILGAGGMGSVFRARDTALGRDVALKFLSQNLLSDPGSTARFEQEARVLAALSHPNIAAIYGISLQPPFPFLVLELVPGETLREKIVAGPIPTDEALAIARQIALALAEAHRHGIVHRDLKPANIKLTEAGDVKVLDFGLAKAYSGLGDKDLTLGVESTTPGTVLGSPGYMSPEQARGVNIDERSDIWAFGCILFELLSCKRAFDGPTAADALAAVLSREPNLSQLPSSTPAPIRKLVRQCLEKDPDRRIQRANEVVTVLDQVQAETRKPSRAPLAIVAILATIALAAVVFTLSNTRTRHLQPTLKQITLAEAVEEQPAWSPDGQEIAYITTPQGATQRKIFRKNIATGVETQLTHGEGDDITPAWSPDGRRILFVRSTDPKAILQPGDVFGDYSNGDIWSLDLSSGKESLLVRNGFDPAFSPDGSRIAVDAGWAGPRRIWTLDAEGHNPQQVTTENSEAVIHLAPRWSRDGKLIAFVKKDSTKFDVQIVNVEDKKITELTDDRSTNIQPVFSPSGKYVYFTSYRSGGLNIWRMPIHRDGTKAGALEQVTTGPGQDIEAAFAPDGKKLAFATLKQNAQVWALPVSPQDGRATGDPRALISSTREDSRGAWAPDGKQIAFNSDRSGTMNIWLANSDGSAARQLTTGAGGDFQPNWSPDQRHIAFFTSRSGSPNLWQVDVSTGALKQLTSTNSIDINPFYSPDGMSIAFQSDRSGRMEVWILNLQDSQVRQLSHEGSGGHFVRWTPAGDAIVFRCPTCNGTGMTMQIPFAGGPATPFVKAAGGSHISLSPDFSRVMDVTGHRAIFVTPIQSGAPEKVFEFPDPNTRIDYPVWAPNGKWVIFDRFRPQGGDVWTMEDFE